MITATLSRNTLPARAAATEHRLVEAILELLAKVPDTKRHEESVPRQRPRARSRVAPPRKRR